MLGNSRPKRLHDLQKLPGKDSAGNCVPVRHPGAASPQIAQRIETREARNLLQVLIASSCNDGGSRQSGSDITPDRVFTEPNLESTILATGETPAADRRLRYS